MAVRCLAGGLQRVGNVHGERSLADSALATDRADRSLPAATQGRQHLVLLLAAILEVAEIGAHPQRINRDGLVIRRRWRRDLVHQPQEGVAELMVALRGLRDRDVISIERHRPDLEAKARIGVGLLDHLDRQGNPAEARRGGLVGLVVAKR